MTNANEPAYPVEISIGENGEITGCCTSNNTGFSIGLSKREMFAAMAMQGLLASTLSSYYTNNPDELASSSVESADALIKQLNSTGINK